MSIKDLILAAQDLKLEKINVPEWGVEVYLSIMTGHERSKFEGKIYNNGKANTDDFHATLLVFTLKNEDGSPIFSEAEIKELSKKSSVVLARLAEKSAVLNNVAPDSAEDIKKLSEQPNERLWYQLAILLGKTVKQLKSEIDSVEFSHWQVFLSVEPRHIIQDVYQSQNYALLYSCNVKEAKPASEFYMDFWANKKEETKQEELAEKLKLFLTAVSEANKKK